MNALPGPSFPLAEAVFCADCKYVFAAKEAACPRCAAVIGIFPLETNEPAKEIGRLRDREAWTTAALLQIAHGLHSTEFKEKVAKKALAYLATGNPQTTTASELPEAAVRKEIN